MIYSLENSKIRITASTHGAELHSITHKEDNTEYLWNRDEKYWKYSSPHLFPIVGKVVDSKYRIGDNVYQLPAHGIARVSEFKLVEKTESSISFKLDYCDESLKVYPYKFSFEVTHTIKDNSVITTYNVRNLDNKEIYFCVGGHPAFMCPIEIKDKLEDCYLEFNEKETISALMVNDEAYFLHNRKDILNESSIINLSKDLFKQGVLTFDNLKSNKISIKSKNNNKVLTVDFGEFDYIAIWAPEKGAPFVCIEPWFGHADYVDFNGQFKDKEGIVKLEEGKEFSASYKIYVK
ncbi:MULTISPECIES: aldose 1-epimerase family protein [Clostridium]|mgnify:FL=1|uniref:aldose 1-epimerase family protein n=1 Tax=Clostridium TaxID=1485 RepID=UPI0005C1F78C|nr:MULTISPECIES: aldose 1-epimerase family protein [Clostridium]AXB86279.1 aldose 1-epimerase family protein [Clostridium butyricum]KIU09455.1 aldose epimerase family protein [Clostridium butyricum]MBA8965782.1 galactose mutarotase-like enzyme [Clostridium butyricum]MBA8969661.1 galactose mutarotase-like enzyme [Clostridium butyricum]MBC2427026.1 aldose 1-epimerase family protein [Clostridium butyricum]